MWPFSKIATLEAEIIRLESRLESLSVLPKDDNIEKDRAELAFLRIAIKPYVTYDHRDVGGSVGWTYVATHCFYRDRTLQEAESDITRLKFYISVLEAELGPDRIASARKVCARLRDLCKTKGVHAIESPKACDGVA